MQRFLLFDSGCEVCTGVAETVERESNGWLRVKGLSNPEMRGLLDRHSPGWAFRPTLMEITGDRVRVSTGLMLSLRLAVGVGPRRAARIARRVAGPVASRRADGPSRRSVLKYAGAGAAALVGIATMPSAAAASESAGGVLAGKDLDEAIASTQANEDFRKAVSQLKDRGYDTSKSESVAIDSGDGTTLMLTFFNSVASPETDAALVAREYGAKMDRVRTELVQVDRAALAKSATVGAGPFTVRVLDGDGIEIQGAGAYFSCMVACIGANCGQLALRCRIIPFIAAMLACMAAICGSKANTCHKVCKPLW